MTEKIVCKICQAELNLQQRSHTCPQCSATSVEYDFDLSETGLAIKNSEKGIWRYRSFLPHFEKTISLGEGQTPLRKALHLFQDKVNLFLKIEGSNPTGSYLDRVSPLMVSDAMSRNMQSLVCASDGNLGASLSAYCAAAQIKCFCVAPKSTSPEKHTQMLAYGAEVIDYGETIDDSLDLAVKMIEKGRYQATPEFNILTIEGAKTVSLEIVEQQNTFGSLKELEYIVVPMGSGGLLYSIWKGLKQAKDFKLIPSDYKFPKIIGVQVEGYDSITKSFDDGNSIQEISKKNISKNKLADAIMVRNPIFGEKAVQSIKESNGIAISVSEKEIIAASKLLGKKEGIFAELSSATVIAAVDNLLKEKILPQNATMLAIITASGMKTSGAFQKSTSQDKKVESLRSMGTKIEILEKINSKDSNFGYGIWKSLGQMISLQAVYQHLRELQIRELIIEIESNDRQKRYSITSKGKQLIKKMNELEELLS
ncbi:MAG: pyridoxal-phosphate dependent enzyme [Candidatus Heimdallarchaeota archaeon]|nr:pyridoxal-phosphate dependent enzyme [Candidatus Heimdallarchaeota archaeon]MBY8993516.1 pyridoxal-phosphate dependent enzyme [Candidatus Heimdallarchaeota archaeon]